MLYEQSGADGIAVARGGLFNPLLFNEITKTGSDFSIKDCAFYLMDLRLQRGEDLNVAHAIRKTLAQMLRGVRGGKDAKQKIFEAQSTNEIKQILNSVL